MENIEQNRLARQYRLMARLIAKAIPPDEAGFTRAGCDCVCEFCQLPYFNHPKVADGQLVIVCDGRQYKL